MTDFTTKAREILEDAHLFPEKAEIAVAALLASEARMREVVGHLRIGQDPDGTVWIYIDGNYDRDIVGAAIRVPESEQATTLLHAERLATLAAPPLPQAEGATPSQPGDAAEAWTAWCGRGTPPATHPPPSQPWEAPAQPSLAAFKCPVAWKFPRRYGSGLSFAKPNDSEDEDGNLEQPVPLFDASALTAAWEAGRLEGREEAARWRKLLGARETSLSIMKNGNGMPSSTRAEIEAWVDAMPDPAAALPVKDGGTT